MALSLTNSFLQIAPPSLSVTKVFGAGSNGGGVYCRKKDIHPPFYKDAKVYCKGELVLTTGGTQKEYIVDVWSGNHSYYLGARATYLEDADQVEKFRKKYGDIPGISEVPVLTGELVLPPRRKFQKKK